MSGISRLMVAILVTGPPVKFECHEAEIHNIERIFHAAGINYPEDTNLRRNWGRSHTAIVKCDAEWEELVPVLESAGYTTGWA